MSTYPPYPEDQHVPASAPSHRIPPGEESRNPRLPLMVGLLTLLLGLLILPYVLERIEYSITRGRQRAIAEVARGELDKLPDIANRYRLVAQAVAPSVVGIDTVQVVQAQDGMARLFPHAYETTGEGSGVIVDTRGYIITNYHVINGAREAKVKLSDGQVISDVTLVGADPSTDIAVLKINAPGLIAAPWGDSDQLQVGDPVLAIGNPFGFDWTVTAGIISAKGRHGIGDARYQDFLQTDAAVNPGNSGGPLVNLKGEVIGINTAIFGRTYRGISFAIPSHAARDVYDQVLKTGKLAERGWLGVKMEELNEDWARQLHLKSLHGVLISEVFENTPAEKAGIQPGDVVVAWGDKPIRDLADLVMAVARTKPGSRASTTVIRDGKKVTLNVQVGTQPQQFQH